MSTPLPPLLPDERLAAGAARLPLVRDIRDAIDAHITGLLARLAP
ncbi:hypothetical protein ACFWSF_01605 [Streptomyces sp. NPDC058611]